MFNKKEKEQLKAEMLKQLESSKKYFEKEIKPKYIIGEQWYFMGEPVYIFKVSVPYLYHNTTIDIVRLVDFEIMIMWFDANKNIINTTITNDSLNMLSRKRNRSK